MTGHVAERFGTVNTVANCAKHYGVPVTDAMLVVSALKGQKVTGADTALGIMWPFACKQDLKAIATANWGEWYGK